MKKKPYGNTTKDQLKASAKDKLYNFIIADGNIRGAMIHGTKMINEMRESFELGILETFILGHAYLGASLMSVNLKGNDQLSIKIECSGPVKGVSVEVNALGEVRGYLKQVPIPITKPLTSLNMSPFFGAGFLSVTKNLENAKSPFTGQIMLEYGNIAQDLANYYLTSEQVPSSFNLSVHFDKDGFVTGAGGLFLQVMPGATEEDIKNIEKIVGGFPAIGLEFANDNAAEKLINEQFKNYSPKILDSRRVEFFCRCNEDKILDYIGMFPLNDLEDIIKNGPFPVEVRCHNCNTLYCFSKEQIEERYHMRKPH